MWSHLASRFLSLMERALECACMPEFASGFGGGGVTRTYGSVAASSRATVITTSATANTKGSWVELTASTTFTSNWIKVDISGVDVPGLLDIGIGAGGSEQVIIPNLQFNSRAQGGAYGPYLFPILIPAGTRIAARAQDQFGTQTMQVSIELISGTNLAGGVCPSMVSEYGATTDSQGTSINSGAVAHTDSSWVQITAATTRDHHWLVFAGVFSTTIAEVTLLIDIGIGAATEQEIVSDIFVSADVTAGLTAATVHHYPIFIPSGSRLTIRARSSATNDSQIFYAKLYGV